MPNEKWKISTRGHIMSCAQEDGVLSMSDSSERPGGYRLHIKSKNDDHDRQQFVYFPHDGILCSREKHSGVLRNPPDLTR
jgi:hypothetical protein